MPIIRLRLKEKLIKSHKVYIEDGITKRIPDILKKMDIGKKYAIITDTIVEKLFAKKLQRELKRKKLKAKSSALKKANNQKPFQQLKKLVKTW